MNRQLLTAAQQAERWFTNWVAGNARNGQHDDVLIARALHDALHQPEDEAERAFQAITEATADLRVAVANAGTCARALALQQQLSNLIVALNEVENDALAQADALCGEN